MSMTRALYSLSALSTELGKDRRTIARALATVPPDGKVSGHAAWYMLTAIAALGWIGRKSDGERLDPEQERARKDKAIADLHELKLAVMRREYFSGAVTTKLVVVVFTRVRTKLLGLSHNVPPFLTGLIPHQAIYGVLERGVHEALAELSEKAVVAEAGNEEAEA